MNIYLINIILALPPLHLYGTLQFYKGIFTSATLFSNCNDPVKMARLSSLFYKRNLRNQSRYAIQSTHQSQGIQKTSRKWCKIHVFYSLWKSNLKECLHEHSLHITSHTKGNDFITGKCIAQCVCTYVYTNSRITAFKLQCAN